MAHSLSDSLFITSDETFDYRCAFCAENSKTTEASFCCNICSKAICVSCKILHQQLFKTHKVLDKDDIDKWTIQRTSSSVLCRYHHGKVLDMFCQDHDQLACDVCVQSKHRGCKKVQHISVASKGINESREMKETLKSVSKITEQLKQLKQNKVSNKLKLKQEALQSRTSIKTLRQKLDLLEANTAQVLDSLLSQQENVIDTEVNTCQFFEKEIHKLSDSINSTGKTDETSAFCDLKRLQNTAADARTFTQDINSDDVTLSFTANQEIEMLLKTLDTLGEVTSNSGTSTSTRMKLSVQSATIPSTVATPSTDHVYQAEYIEKYDMKTKNDNMTPYINGICVLSDGNTVMTDWRNNKLKLLDSSYRVIDEYDLPPKPQGLCHITGCEVALTVWGGRFRHMIQIINVVRGSITRNRTIKLDHDCRSIVYHNAQLFVGGGNDGLYVYNMDGNNKRRLYEDFVWGVTVNGKDQVVKAGV